MCITAVEASKGPIVISRFSNQCNQLKKRRSFLDNMRAILLIPQFQTTPILLLLQLWFYGSTMSDGKVGHVCSKWCSIAWSISVIVQWQSFYSYSSKRFVDVKRKIRTGLTFCLLGKNFVIGTRFFPVIAIITRCWCAIYTEGWISSKFKKGRSPCEM